MVLEARLNQPTDRLTERQVYRWILEQQGPISAIRWQWCEACFEEEPWVMCYTVSKAWDDSTVESSGLETVYLLFKH